MFRKIIKVISKIITWAIIVILISIGAFLLYVTLVSKIAQKQGHESPVGLYTIISPSMTPNVNVYDVVFTFKTDVSKLKVGDIVSYKTPLFGDTPITHRIIETFNTNEGYVFRTKGDFNIAPDQELVNENEIVGKVMFKIPQLGRLQFFLISKKGWFIAILIPALGIIAYDIFKIAKLMAVKRKIKEENEPNKDADSKTETEITEEIKEVVAPKDKVKDNTKKTTNKKTNTKKKK